MKSLSIKKGNLLILITTNKSLDIACSSKLSIDFNWLPKLDYGIINDVFFIDCEIPQNKSLQQTFQNLDLEHVKVLRVDCYNFHKHTPQYGMKLFQDFKDLELLVVDCPGVKFGQDDLRHLTSLKKLTLNINNVEAPANVSSIAPSLESLELYTDLIQIAIYSNQYEFNVKIRCLCETDDYINDIPTLVIEGNVKGFSISECSLPHNNSLAIFKNKFNIEKFRTLSIESSEVNKNRTLSSEHFKGLEDVIGLLIKMIVMNSTEDAFKYLHNLEFLEITGNIVTTSSSPFEKLRLFRLDNSKFSMVPRNLISSESITHFEIINNEVAWYH